jgi:DNA (cytosine-5)-methyltransferase 1
MARVGQVRASTKRGVNKPERLKATKRALCGQQSEDNPNADSSFIRQSRKECGLTQKGMSSALGMGEVGARTVRAWENGEQKPSQKMVKKITSLIQSKSEKPAPFEFHGPSAFKFIDLFAGIGGIRLPFQEIGGECVFSSEWDKYSQKTYYANYKEVPHGDITKIDAADIPDHDVLLAGFPCQAFSQAGLRQGFYDTRGTMFFEIQRIMAEKRPVAFMLENVKQLRGHDKGRTLSTILDILGGKSVAHVPDDVPLSDLARANLAKKLNYQVAYAVLKANDFGVPQKRERIYIVGFDRDVFPNMDLSDFFSGLETSSEPTCLGNVLEENSSVPDSFTISDRLYAGHLRRRREHAEKGNGFGFSVFNRESPYCNTISARYYKDGSEVLIDQMDIGKNPRKLTPRECAGIQGFPDEFIVDAVSTSQIYRQFGNSVSVPVIRAIAKRMQEKAAGRLSFGLSEAA